MELDGLRLSIARGRPFGMPDGTAKTVRKLAWRARFVLAVGPRKRKDDGSVENRRSL